MNTITRVDDIREAVGNEDDMVLSCCAPPVVNART